MFDSTFISAWKSRFAILGKQEFWQRVDVLLRIWGPLLLGVFAFCYYAQYYRSGLNLGGEGGTAAVIAMRLNEGYRPFLDTTLNYNVLWFYPIAWFFQITGPDYITLRVYFFVLCLLTGWLGFFIVRRVTRSGWYALGIGLFILMIPGMIFRNYIGLITLLNAWVMLHAFVWDAASHAKWRRWAWFVAAGLTLGVTYLLRIDVALFFTFIYFGLILLYPLGVRGEFWQRSLIAISGGMVCLLAAIAIHLPFYFDAQHRGFGSEFLAQYLGKWSYIKYEVNRSLFSSASLRHSEKSPKIPMNKPSPVSSQKTPKNLQKLDQAEQIKPVEVDRHGRMRPSLDALLHQESFYDAVFILILYLPILVGGIVFIISGGVLAWAIFNAQISLKESTLVCLLMLGSAFTIFPQYFFFRPDTPHLSEFMVPFLVTMACACFYAMRLIVTEATSSKLLRLSAALFLILCFVSEGLYFYHSFPKESAGTIAAARKRSYEVIASNGVRVFVKRGQQKWLQDLHDLIVKYSTSNEWVITFPYSPTINFMTNRRSYLKDLYIDNATVGRNFRTEKIAEFERFKPAVIVVDQRPINNFEFSRFRNWAASTYEYIRSHYVLIGTFDTNEMYIRPDKLPPQT